MTGLERESKICERIVETIGATFVGKRSIIRKMVAGAMASGHILFEDYPGLGKTLLVKAFARSIGVNFTRVQFTPDVLPSDILGTKIWDQKSGNFKLARGPIFTNILLADEINRSPPKTQSALLEAMEERQVTIEGETLRLDAPFFVLATQNPIEQEGSLALDESVFVNGQLRTGRELLERAGRTLARGRRGVELHDIDAWTYALNPEGRFERKDCLLYTLPYRKDFLCVRTKTGRRIRVTRNHPFLVNEAGSIRWKKAEELAPGDFLVQPARLPDPPAVEFPTHGQALDRMIQRPVPREIPMDEDFIFWIAFLLSDGTIGPNYVEAVQKNYPEALDRWVAISRRYGFRPSTRLKKGVRHAKVYSKPLVEYLRVRIGVFGGRDKEIPSHFLGLDASLNREFLRTFVSLESSLRDNRVVFTQKSERNANLIAYMLLREGIRSYLRHDGRVWRLKIQGADAVRFLRQIGWIDPAKARSFPLDRALRTSHRVVPVERGRILRMVRLLGLAGFHTLPGRTALLDRPWYGSYRGIKDGESVMAEDALRTFVEDLRQELAYRDSPEFSRQLDQNPRAFASGVGMPITEIASDLSISKNQVWQLYSRGHSQQAALVKGHLRAKAELRLEEARQTLKSLAVLIESDVFYDPIRSIQVLEGDGFAFGLTVPGAQNYVAGLGACGISHNTYPLPEAQMDRFLLKMSTGYPETEQLEAEILTRRISWQKDDPTQDVKPIITGPSFRDLQRIVETKIFIHKELLLYISKLVRGLRAHPKVQVGPSPRGSLGLLKASRAMALMNGRDYVSPDDVKLFVYEALSHRTLLSVEHVLDGVTPTDVVREVVQSVPVPTRFLESQAKQR